MIRVEAGLPLINVRGQPVIDSQGFGLGRRRLPKIGDKQERLKFQCTIMFLDDIKYALSNEESPKWKKVI
jgi:hypothetical protein